MGWRLPYWRFVDGELVRPAAAYCAILCVGLLPSECGFIWIRENKFWNSPLQGRECRLLYGNCRRTSALQFFRCAAWVRTLWRRGRSGVPDIGSAKSKHKEVIHEI
jgi:hypothetical protein